MRGLGDFSRVEFIEGESVASELGDAATFVRQDVTQEGDWKTAVNAAEKLGGLHGLVNNAGIYQPRTLMETETELFERHTRVNQLGCFLGMKTVVPLMEQSGGGSIVNISLRCWSPQIPRRNRIPRHQMGVKGPIRGFGTGSQPHSSRSAGASGHSIG